MGGVNTASAQNSATFTMSDGTLTVSGKGDLSQATITTDDKVFTDAAVNNVFTTTDNSTYTSVGSGAKVNASTNYYTASRTYTQITDIASKATEKDVYEFTDKAYGALWVFSNKIGSSAFLVGQSVGLATVSSFIPNSNSLKYSSSR